MKKNKKKGRPNRAGSPWKQGPALDATQVSASIVADPHPFVKWLEGLRPGTLFSTGKKIYTVSAVEPVRCGRMITLAMANSLAAKPPITEEYGYIRHK